MKLSDLDPHWLTFDGRRVGFIFRSPIKPEWWQTCFVEPFAAFRSRAGTYPSAAHGFAPDSQAGIVGTSLPEAREHFQPCDPKCQWQATPPISEATFENISVTPSLDGSKGGFWHGYVTNGEIVGGI